MRFFVKASLIMMFALLQSACDEVKDIDARKDPSLAGTNPNGDDVTNTTLTYNGSLTETLDNLGGECPKGSGATVKVDFTNKTVDLTIPDPDDTGINGSIIVTAQAASSITKVFSGLFEIQDSIGEFNNSGCDLFGGYANVVQINIDGETSSNDNTIINAPYVVKLICNGPTPSKICEGTFTGAKSSN